MEPKNLETSKPRNPGTLLVLAHGAGAGQAHPFMVRYARGLAERGIDVATFNFPYMDAGRRAPDKAPVLEEAFRNAIRAAVAQRGVEPTSLVIGGKSMGGRIATHLAAAPESWPDDLPASSGVLVLGYPLTPPGGGRKQDRVSHLFRIAVPTLIVQGTRDSFGGPDDVRASLAGGAPLIAVHEVEGGDHSFAILESTGRTQADVDAQILGAVSDWISRLGTANGASPAAPPAGRGD